VLAATFEEWLGDARALSELQWITVTAGIAARAGTFGDGMHGDPIDKLVTADTTIRTSESVRTIW
jgi:hypothetical protein